MCVQTFWTFHGFVLNCADFLLKAHGTVATEESKNKCKGLTKQTNATKDMFVSYVRTDIHPITFFSSSVSLQPLVSKFKQID